jgi:hypothetical protein
MTDASFSPIYAKWARWCLFNLLLVAAAGVILRSKIIFPLEFIQQKNFLHGHSHFAFSGWVSASLMAAIISLVYPAGPGKKMSLLFRLQMIASYGMLLTFPLMGYKLPSIFFSTLTIIISYLFCYYIWKPLAILPPSVTVWFRTALFCNLFSSLGTFLLAYLMMKGSHSQELTIGSLYFFLHFQYNGWFFFSCAGLFFYFLHQSGASWPSKTTMNIWRLLVITVIPGYFLSALWMKLPFWMYALAIFAAILQLPAVFIFLKQLMSKTILPALTPLARYCLTLSLVALSVKFILQALSCIPSLSVYAFGYRSLVIAFLHLVLLGFVSLFILGYFLQSGFLPVNKGVKTGIYILTTGIIMNEALLMVQGLGAIGYIAIPHTNEVLWIIALIMLSGIFMLNYRSAPVNYRKPSSLQ